MAEGEAGVGCVDFERLACSHVKIDDAAFIADFSENPRKRRGFWMKKPAAAWFEDEKWKE